MNHLILIILIYKKASLTELDEEKRKPIDFIKDEAIKLRLLSIKEAKSDALPVKVAASMFQLFHHESENREPVATQSEIEELFGSESAGFAEIATRCCIL
jgi:hypothetical protein